MIRAQLMGDKAKKPPAPLPVALPAEPLSGHNIVEGEEPIGHTVRDEDGLWKVVSIEADGSRNWEEVVEESTSAGAGGGTSVPTSVP